MLHGPNIQLPEVQSPVCKNYRQVEQQRAPAGASIGDQPNWSREEHERLRMESGAPLSARTTAIEAWCQANPVWKTLYVEIGENDALVALALLGYRARFACIEALLLGPQDEPGWIAGRSTSSVQRLAAGVRAALESLERPWLLRLPNMPILRAPVHQFLAQFAHVRLGSKCHGVRLLLAPGAPLRSVTTRNTRAAVAKARNRIARDRRRLELDWLGTLQEVETVLPDLVRIHKSRNIQLRGTSRLEDPAVYSEFTRRVLAHAEEGNVRLLVTRIDDQVAAFALCVLDARTLYVYANLAAPEWLTYSAGTITNHAVVAWARANEVDAVDWGLGVQRYKLSGPIALEPHSRVEIYSSAGTETAVLAARSMRSALRPFLLGASHAMR